MLTWSRCFSLARAGLHLLLLKPGRMVWLSSQELDLLHICSYNFCCLDSQGTATLKEDSRGLLKTTEELTGLQC